MSPKLSIGRLHPRSIWLHLFCGAGHEKKEGRAVKVVPGI